MFKIPSNGLYLTDADAGEYQNTFAQHAESVQSTCKECAASCAGCGNGNIKTVTFVLTEACNLACTYCYETHKTNNAMTKEIAKKAIDYLFSEDIQNYFGEVKVDGYVIDFFGGEPMLQAEVMDYAATYFKEKCFVENRKWLQNSMFSMTTNGTLYFTEAAQTYIKHHGSKTSMGITIDGNKKLHDACRVFHNGKGSFDVVQEAVKDWIGKTRSVAGTKVTIAPGNIEYLYEAFVSLWEETGLQFLASNCVFEDVWEPHHAQTLYDELIKVADYLIDNDLYAKYYTRFFHEELGQQETSWDTNACGGNGQMLAVGPDGRLYPCMRFMKYALSYQDEKCIGDLENGININDPWLQDLKKVTLESQSDDECKNCPISFNCGICTGWHYDKFGTPNKRAKFICEMHKARVCANEYYWNKLYKKLGLNKTFDLPINNPFRK